MPVCAPSTCAMSSCVISACVCLCDLNLFDVYLCDVKLCDAKQCDVKLRDVNLYDVMSSCVLSICVMSAGVMSIFVMSIGVTSICLMSSCAASVCATPTCVMSLCAMSSCMPARHQRKIFASPSWDSYPEHNLHTARRLTRITGRRQHKLFASPHGPGQLPRTQFTHSNAPNPHGRNTSTQNFRISAWHSYPERNLHTATRQTRCSHLRMAHLPRTQFTHSKAPNPNGRKTATENFRISARHSYPEHNLHIARHQTRMAETHQFKIFASPHGTATPNAIYKQQGAKPAWQKRLPRKSPAGRAT